MNELRFKVYLKKENRFIVDAKYYFCGDFAYIYEYNGGVYNKEYEIESKYICQYTGLKDKNGKEIYFDDIIQHQEYLYQVVWNVDKIGFIQIKATITDFTIYADGGECLKSNYGRYFERKNLFNFDSCEIIGNIYENPDLMASIANNNI